MILHSSLARWTELDGEYLMAVGWYHTQQRLHSKHPAVDTFHLELLAKNGAFQQPTLSGIASYGALGYVPPRLPVISFLVHF